MTDEWWWMRWTHNQCIMQRLFIEMLRPTQQSPYVHEVLIDFVDVACERKVGLVGDCIRSGVLVIVAAFAVWTPAVEVLLPQAQSLCTKRWEKLSSNRWSLSDGITKTNCMPHCTFIMSKLSNRLLKCNSRLEKHS